MESQNIAHVPLSDNRSQREQVKLWIAWRADSDSIGKSLFIDPL